MAQTLFDGGDLNDGTLTVGEVSRRVERALRREFGDRPVWVRGEMRDLNRPPSGHVHFTLTGPAGGEEHDDRALPVVLFAGDRDRVNRTLKASGAGVRMEDGIEVRIRVEVRWFAPKAQVSLRMVGIDPTFTLGRLAEDRELLLRRLGADGLLEAQQRHQLPLVPLRVGLVTSLGSAAHADVHRILDGSGLGFRVVECDSRVQGIGAGAAVAAALTAVAGTGVDAVCLVRGGGARTDLAAFDDEELARAVATLAVPVLTGIGHETDTSVADEVAWRRLPTPTACAAFLVERVRHFCTRRDELLRRCVRAAATATSRSADRLERDTGRLGGAARRHLRDAGRQLDTAAGVLARRPLATLDAAGAALEHRSARVAGLDPDRMLARGWTITHTVEGALVKAPADAGPGIRLRTRTAGGEIVSTVEDPS
jgi:exodeoxyribonuclease VII large subunit